MKVEHVVEELKQVAQRLGFQVRTERGGFRGGRCTVSGEDVIVLNRLHIPELQISILAESLREADLEGVYVKPSVRRALEEAWAREDERLQDSVEATDE